MADSSSPSMWHVNKRLLPVKAVYFLFLAGIGDLLPFITVYMKQLGLSTTEAGIMYGVVPFIAFFVRPWLGVLADKTRKHRLMLILCCVMTGVCHTLLLLTPSKSDAKGEMMTSVRTEVDCDGMDSFIRDCDAMQHNKNDNKNETFDAENIQLCDMSLRRFAELSLVNATDVRCKAMCGISFTSRNMHMCFTDNIGSYDSSKCGAMWNLTEINSEIDFEITDLTAVIRNKVIGQNTTYHGNVCQNYDLKNVSYAGKEYWQFQCDAETFLECKITCDSRYHHACITFNPKLSQTFWVFFVIFFFCNIFFSPVLSLVDAMVYDILGNEKRRQWGRQRFWGTVGFALFAITSSFLMDHLRKSDNDIDYSVSFYIFLALNVFAGVAGYFLDFSDAITCSQVFKNMGQLFKFPQVVVFLVIVFMLGIFNSVPKTFLFWYLQDLGAPQILLGLCVVFACVPELVMFMVASKIIKKIGHVPCLYLAFLAYAALFLGYSFLIACWTRAPVASKIIKKIGHVPCLYLAFLAYAVRFLGYSFLTNPWYVLLIEPLHSLNYALMYSAASGYASIITPQGMSATVQGLIGGIYLGLGKGVGSLFTGKLFDPVSGIGPVWTFRLHAVLSLVTLVVYFMVQTIFFRHGHAGGKQSAPTEEKSDDQDEDTVTADGMPLRGNSVSNDNAD